VTNKDFYVYYTVNPPFTEKPTQLCAGPYSESEVCSHRIDIAGYAGVSNVYVAERKKETTS
jgi:hypothetical protein